MIVYVWWKRYEKRTDLLDKGSCSSVEFWQKTPTDFFVMKRRHEIVVFQFDEMEFQVKWREN